MIAAQEHCTIQEAIGRSVALHNEFMHTYEREAAVLAALGSPGLGRFLGGYLGLAGGQPGVARHHRALPGRLTASRPAGRWAPSWLPTGPAWL